MSRKKMNGFARIKCPDYGHEYLLAFSCKRRHFCPSCHQKRVVEFGEWLCQKVIKAVPHRHFGFSKAIASQKKGRGPQTPPFLDLTKKTFPGNQPFSRPTATRSFRSFSRLAGFMGTRGSRGGPDGRPIICKASLTGTGFVSMNNVLTKDRVL